MKWERIYIYMCEDDFAKGEAEVGGRNWRHIVVMLQIWKLSVFSQIKAAINKPVTKRLWFTYLQPAMFRVLLSSSLLRTRWLAVCSLLAANIKDAHTELISRGHLYNNTFAPIPMMQFWLFCHLFRIWFLLLNGLWMLCIFKNKYALMTIVKH